MSDKLASFFTKFADNAHLGKIATDLAPGIILTFTLLLLLSTFTHVKIFPYADRKELGTAATNLHAEYQKADSIVQFLQRQKDSLESKAQILFSGPGKEKDSANFRAQLVGRELDRQKTERDTLKTRWRDLTKQVEGSFLLTLNLDVLTEHFMALFFVGYMLGVILAQVSGGLFYNGIFYDYFKDKYKDILSVLYPDGDLKHRTSTYFKIKITDKTFLDRIPDLETDFFRYMEVAMNMILPVLTLSLAFLAIIAKTIIDLGATHVPDVHFTSFLPYVAALGVVALGGGEMTLFLYKNARENYVGYFIKKADVVKAMQEQLQKEATGPVNKVA